MRNTLLIILTFVCSLSFAQTEKPENKIVTENFVKSYNNNNYDAIFSMFADAMKEALPEDKTNQFLQGLKSQAGNISKTEFLKYKNGTYASYKTTFERAILSLNISIDDNSKINGLFVKPYTEEANSATVKNNQKIKDSIITKKQSEIIFEKVKAFPEGTELSIAIIQNGKTDFYGIKKKNDSISTIQNQNSVFEIGSITKVFTSTLLANSVIEEKVKLNEDISRYLNTTFKNNTKISFKDLANHTSGLSRLPSNLNLAMADPENPYKAYNEDDLMEYLTEYLELTNKGEYQYSNLGAGLLGYALSKIENKTFENLLQEKIFDIYDMQHSTSEINKIKRPLIKGLNSDGEEVSNWEFTVLAGAGAIFSTVEDLSYFALAQFKGSNKALELTRTKTVEVNKNMDIGLGWHILNSKSQNPWYWHNGGTGGYSSSMAIDVNNQNGIIILSNVSAFHPNNDNIDQLCFELMKTLDAE